MCVGVGVDNGGGKRGWGVKQTGVVVVVVVAGGREVSER